MKHTLIDSQTKKEVTVDITVDYSFNPKDVFAIFIAKQATCGLLSNHESSPYDEYCFKRVLNVIVGSCEYNNHSYTITLGAYMDYSDISYFLIDEKSDDTYVRFDDDVTTNDFCYESVKLFNYAEYCDVCEITGAVKLPIRDFIAQVCNRSNSYHEYTLYNTISNQKDFNLFIPHADFTKFLDNEEERTKVL